MELAQRGAAEGLAMIDQARALVDQALEHAGLPPAKTSSTPAAPAPVEVARQRGTAQDLHGALESLNVDETTIMRVLRNQSAGDVAALRTAYRNLYGGSLDDLVARKLDGEDLAVARFLLQGERRAEPKPSTTTSPADLAAPLFAELDAVNGDEVAVLQMLAGKSAAETAHLREEYRRHYGRDLETNLAGTLDDDELGVARAHLSGNRGAGAAAAIVNDPDLILSTLRSLSPVDQGSLMVELALRGHGSLDAFLAENLDDDGLEEARELVRGERGKADARRLEVELQTLPLQAAFRGHKPTLSGEAEALLARGDDREALAAAYLDRTGHTLDEDLAQTFDGGDERRARALAAGDAVGAAAGTLETLTDGEISAPRLVAALEAMPPATRREALRRYEQTTGSSLEARVNDDAGALDALAVHQAATYGTPRPEVALYWSMKGVGTKTERVRGTLDGLSQAEAEAAAARYEQATREPLRDALEGDLSGRDEDLALLAATGRPATIEAAMERSDDEWDVTRGSGAGILSGVTDLVYDGGEMMDLQHQRLRDLRVQLAAASDEEKPALLAKAADLVGWQQSDRQLFESEEDRVASAAGTTVQLGATLAATALTGGGAAAALLGRIGGLVGLSPITSSLMAANLVGGVAGIGARRAIKGDGYGGEELGGDIAMTAAQVASAGVLSSEAVATRLPDAVARVVGGTPGTTKLVTEGLTGVLGAVPTALVSSVVDEGGGEGGGDAIMSGILCSLLGGALGGVAAGRLERALGGLGRGTTSPWRAFAQGALGNGLGSVAEQAVMPGTFDGDAGDVTARLLFTALPGAVHGGLGHYGRARQRNAQQPRLAMLA